MFNRIRRALELFARTRFTWRTAWRHAKPTGAWHTRADEDGNVEIVRSGP
jgi:hypothetical protein